MNSEVILSQIQEQLKLPGNNVCLDCGDSDVRFISTNLGVTICPRCASAHRSLGHAVSKVKNIDNDIFDERDLESLRKIGNLRSKRKYEKNVPSFYGRPNTLSPPVLREEWIRAKFERLEFIDPSNADNLKPGPQIYSDICLEFDVMKKGKSSPDYEPRKFILNRVDGTLLYYDSPEGKEKAKDIILVDELNATFVPRKMANPNGLQLMYMKEGKTRNLFIFTQRSRDIVNLYQAIRSLKLSRLSMANPNLPEAILMDVLAWDFVQEGWLHKSGSRGTEPYKKRWFTFDGRILYYYEGPLDAYPKGEIYIGTLSEGCCVLEGVPPGTNSFEFSFTIRLKRNARRYFLSASTAEERSEWMNNLTGVMKREPTAKDKFIYAGRQEHFEMMAAKKQKSIF